MAATISTSSCSANPADLSYNPFRIAPRKHLAQVQVLEACGMQLKSVKVRILSTEESRYVRSHFTQKTKNDLWQLLFDQKQQEIRRLYPRITNDKFQSLTRQQIARFNKMDLHHACQIMTCPIGHSPYEDWDRTLEWWRTNAHYRLVATNRTLHELIHRVQDYKIVEAFGEEAFQGSRQSGDLIGNLKIITRPGGVWDFARPGLELSALHLMRRESERKAALREQISRNRATGENIYYMSPEMRPLPSKPASSRTLPLSAL